MVSREDAGGCDVPSKWKMAGLTSMQKKKKKKKKKIGIFGVLRFLIPPKKWKNVLDFDWFINPTWRLGPAPSAGLFRKWWSFEPRHQDRSLPLDGKMSIFTIFAQANSHKKYFWVLNKIRGSPYIFSFSFKKIVIFTGCPKLRSTFSGSQGLVRVP